MATRTNEEEIERRKSLLFVYTSMIFNLPHQIHQGRKRRVFDMKNDDYEDESGSIDKRRAAKSDPTIEQPLMIRSQ